MTLTPLKIPLCTNDHLAMSYLIDVHLAHLRARGQSERTVGARGELLRRLHHELPYGLAYAATDELDAWLGSHPSWSRWTRATYAMHIRGFYRWATTAGHLDGDPAADMAKPRNPRCLPNPVTDDELVQALDRSADPWHTARSTGEEHLRPTDRRVEMWRELPPAPRAGPSSQPPQLVAPTRSRSDRRSCCSARDLISRSILRVITKPIIVTGSISSGAHHRV